MCNNYYLLQYYRHYYSKPSRLNSVIVKEVNGKQFFFFLNLHRKPSWQYSQPPWRYPWPLLHRPRHRPDSARLHGSYPRLVQYALLSQGFSPRRLQHHLYSAVLCYQILMK